MALLGSDSSDYAPPYAVPRLPKMGDPSQPADPGMPYSQPYIGGPGDPNAGRIQMPQPTSPAAPAGGSNYGAYLGWDQGKLNDPTHNTIKYQFLRAMLDKGISSQNRDLTGAVSALQARGYPVSAVPGSSDQIKWGDQGTYDIFNGTNGDFFFGQQGVTGAPSGQVAPQGMPPMSGQPGQANTAPDLGLGPWNGSSYGPSLADSMAGSHQRSEPAFGGRYGAYQPPYMNGAV